MRHDPLTLAAQSSNQFDNTIEHYGSIGEPLILTDKIFKFDTWLFADVIHCRKFEVDQEDRETEPLQVPASKAPGNIETGWANRF